MNILNKLKRGLAGLLSLSVAVSAVFVFHFPLIKAYAAEDECIHEREDWTEWTATDRLPDKEGRYYLSSDVTLQSDEETNVESWAPKNGTYLCLNGHSIEMADEDKYVIIVNNGRIFNLYDCEGEGTNGYISHITNVNGSGVCVEKGGTFNMYGGKISDNGNEFEDNFDGGGVYNEGTFNMHGGDISGNKVGGDGGGVYNNGTFYMDGGYIYGNKATNGGGVHNDSKFEMLGGTIGDNNAQNGGKGYGVYADGTFTVGGTATVAEGDNVYLPSGKVITISSEKPLRGSDTTIFVTTEELPEEATDDVAAKDVEIAKSSNHKNYRLFFETTLSNVYSIYKNGSVMLSTINPERDEYYKDAVEPEVPNDSNNSDSSETSNSESSEPTSSESSDSSDSSDSSETNSSESSGDDNPGNNDDNPHHENDTNPWKPFDKDKFESETETTFFYLEEDFELTDTLKPANNTYLCLNGHTITIDDNKPVISVTGFFTLCDDEGGGKITHGQGGGVGVSVAQDGKFAMLGGEISGNKGDGVKIESGGELTVGGTAKILDEVYLLDGQTITIDKKKPLENGAKIVVKPAADPTDGDVAIAVKDGNDDKPTAYYSQYFESYNKELSIKCVGDTIYLTKEHVHGDNTLTATATLPGEAGHYYLTQDVTVPEGWSPAEGTYICLNGHTITGTIPINNSGVTLCDCNGAGTATVTVSADKTITVGGKLKANITLNDGALIDVDSNYGLETGASITVTLGTPLADGGSAAITTANGGAYSTCFKSAITSYNKTVEGGVVKFTKPKSEVPVEPDEHTDHAICGDRNCEDGHTDITWTEWTSTTTLPEDAGSYYLANNVTLTAQWKPTSDINLCLNGYTITMNANDTAIYIMEDLSICDCSVKMLGTITHASGKTGRGVYIASGGAFTMYGGNIKGNSTSADGAGVYNDGTFDMLGGEITGNKSTSGSGGGLYNKGFAQIEGSINKNSASKKGGGVYQDGKLTIDEDAYIMYNTVGSSKSNVYLTDGSQIIIGSKYNGEIGVTLETSPKANSPITFAKGTISSSTVNKIKSDSSSFKVAKSGSKLTLSKKSTTSSSDDSDFELEISDPLASSAIPTADRTAIINALKDMPSWVVGTYYDVTLWEDDEEIDDAGESLTVKLTIPSSIRATNRDYKVIRVHDGRATVLDGTVDSSKTTITVKSRYFSTYAIIYSVSQSGVGSSGTSSNGGYGNPAMGVQNDIPLAGLACGFTVLALAAPGKKFEQ